jgi:hypothetical protein
MRRAVIVLSLALTGCASTIWTDWPDGRKETIRIGFGNKISRDTLRVEPSERALEAGERLGALAVERASEVVAAKIIDAVTTATE